MLRSILPTLLLVMASVLSPRSTQQVESGPLPLGVLIPRVVTAKDAQQTYALYLPQAYSREKNWPVVYVFDPLARGAFALHQFEHAAEVHGFIIAASNNSRNGPWAPQIEAAEAMVNDTQQRLAIDTKRMYFAGFSGGARLSARLALLCKCAAGVLLSGAGFPQSAPPSASAKFAVFSAVGNADFNYSEVLPLQAQLEKALLQHWLRIFDGPHEWAPVSVIDEALAWFRLQAMKSNLESRNDEFIAAQAVAATRLAWSFQTSGDLLSAAREYRQIAGTFDSQADVTAARSKAELLAKDKSVRDGLKRERSAFDEQSRLSDEVLSAVSRPAGSDQMPTARSASQLAHDLRQRSLAERKPDRVLILKRALGGVFIGAIESGSAALEEKDFSQAAQYFACAAEANPDSEWIFRQLAVARALSGDRKGAIEALRSARKLTKDAQSLSQWCKTENAFDKVRGTPEFNVVAQ